MHQASEEIGRRRCRFRNNLSLLDTECYGSRRALFAGGWATEGKQASDWVWKLDP